MKVSFLLMLSHIVPGNVLPGLKRGGVRGGCEWLFIATAQCVWCVCELMPLFVPLLDEKNGAIVIEILLYNGSKIVSTWFMVEL